MIEIKRAARRMVFISMKTTTLIVVGGEHVEILRHRGTQRMECHNGRTRKARVKARRGKESSDAEAPDK